ncbi:MAG TPA: hypothetical protein VKY89_13930 [Thermoanaerobaculia bacterium]|nr:hypothetical protein [Thermoanaerobaculia bacterium]
MPNGPPEHGARAPAPEGIGRAVIPLFLRVCWLVLLGCAGVLVAAVVGLAEQLGLPLLAGLPGPLLFGGMLLFLAWWHTRGPGRHLWSSPTSFGRRWWS